MLSKYINLNACYKKNKTQLFEPSKILEVGNKKIGFVGVVTPLTFSKTYISTLREDDGTPIYDFLSNEEEMYSAIQKEVNRLKNDEKTDYVILLTHVGMDIEEYTSNGILSNIENVDAVLDGHTHKVYNTTSKDKTNKDILISQTGTKLANIGKLVIKTDGTITSENINEVPEPEDKTGAKKINRGKADRWVDTETNDLINQIYEKYSDELNIPFGYSDYDFIIRAEDTSDSQQIYCRSQECTLGNMIADAFREVIESNISYVNGGNVRDSLLKGNITRKDIIDIMPFFNSLFVKEITGEAFLNALEFGVSKLPEAFGGFPQVSGCTFYVNTSFKSTVETDENGMFIKVGGQRRVSNVKINGKPLVLTQKYNLSASEYILSGGDGFTMFSQFPSVNESIFTDSDAFGHFIKYNLNGKIPSDYQKLQNRINIDKKIEDEDDDDGNVEIINNLGEFLKRNIKFLILTLIALMF
jgi:2',3'-cyclic-nucleotide 2'-phosphodiesterase (5'-nucleotidase family)